jgi:hypothetical protein
MATVPAKKRMSVDEIVRREEPGYIVSKPALSDARQQAKPDAVVPPISAIRQKGLTQRGPGADTSRQPTLLAPVRDTEVRVITSKHRSTDASSRAMGPKAVIVSKSKGIIVSRQG